MNPVSWTKQKRGFYMGKLSFEDKINLYNDRKSGVSISSLCSKYKILHANVKYLTRLIDKHGYDILRKIETRNLHLMKRKKLLIVYY